MRAVVISRNGGPEVLRVEEWPSPEPGPGQLLVEVAAGGVNFRDIYEREGAGGYGGPTPQIAGVEGAGRVRALGEGVVGFTIGDRVAWIAAPGSHAEQVVVDAARAVPIPDEVSDELAAGSMMQGITAQYLSASAYAVRPGETVLVHAAAGGVGGLLTQMVNLRGGRVIGTASTEKKRALARAHGADEVIGYESFGALVRELTGGEGVAAVYDGIGKATFDESLASLRPRGVMVLTGAVSGPVPPVDIGRLTAGALYLTRPTLGRYTASREELLERAGAVLGLVATGVLQIEIGGRYRMAEARQAHEDLEGRRTAGKLLLLPQ